MYGGLSKKLVCFLFIQMGMNGFSDYHCQFVGINMALLCQRIGIIVPIKWHNNNSRQWN